MAITEKTLYILGAGASRGHGVNRYPKPPTVREFFHRRFMSKMQKKYPYLLKSLRKVLERSEMELDSVNVEELFSMIEPIWELGVIKKQINSLSDKLPTAEDFVTPLDMLRSWVVDVIHLSTGWLRQVDCPYHQALAKRAISRNESIITFNYDLVMDFALLRTGEWSTKSGYGWNSHGKSITFKDNTGFESTLSEAESCLLLKPHGSLNFFRSTRFNEKMKGREGMSFGLMGKSKDDEEYSNYQKTDCIEIRNPRTVMVAKRSKNSIGSPPFVGPSLYDMYAKAKDDAKPLFYLMLKPGHDLSDSAQLPYLVMPTPFKSLAAMKFAELNLVWQLVAQLVERATKIVTIGFTFYDPHFNAILAKTTSASEHPKQMIVVSPRLSTITDIKNRLKATNLVVKPFQGTFADYFGSTLSK